MQETHAQKVNNYYSKSIEEIGTQEVKAISLGQEARAGQVSFRKE